MKKLRDTNVLKHQQTIICLTRQKTAVKCCEDRPKISADRNVNAWNTGTGVSLHSVCARLLQRAAIIQDICPSAAENF